jgi:hypothetical protein
VPHRDCPIQKSSMLDRLAKTDGMLPPSSFMDMGGTGGQSLGVPEYHYTQVRLERGPRAPGGFSAGSTARSSEGNIGYVQGWCLNVACVDQASPKDPLRSPDQEPQRDLWDPF